MNTPANDNAPKITTRAAAMALADRQLGAAMDFALKHHEEFLIENGATPNEVIASLAQYSLDLAAWRRDARAKIERIIEAPDAPSHSVN
jgi:hypothetical protein